ncbi:class A beta-lactamase [Pseudomonas putida]|jgi:beta-lactamase class A/beta-lactamase class A CARB-5|uniref:beta-lactamase n=1 Tax=Pseudomonas putida TaxID=303 RepID=A0A2S3XAD2_PSEPU|nr:class A beta-lactamase [Pseudomonas putida]POG01751.1 class A beta-lactamase [Pseudomonas putida]POG12417.1 class A beta-lactamase [Pseudomonas putida]
MQLSGIRQWISGAAAVAIVAMSSNASAADDPIRETALRLENALDARIGYAIHDTGTGLGWEHRADERFPMASTVKLLVCSALLRQGQVRMKKAWQIQQESILPHSPVTQNLVGKQVAASDLCAFTLKTSDNAAANGVLEVLGGPAAVNAFLQEIGDQTTRSDRNEPSLNEGQPGDLRDTTTPKAMAGTMKSLVLGSALKDEPRRQLTEWLMSNQVGGPLLRAGIPGDWRIADKTGSGGFGTRGVVAVMWPPQRAPIVAAIYLTETTASMDERNAAIAEIGRAMVKAVAP